VPDGIFVAVVHPHCRVSTKAARARLATHVFPLPAIVANAGNLGALVAALYQGDTALLGRSVADALVEPVRAGMIPGFAAVKAAACEAGALACSISGSGPSMFAFTDTADLAAHVAQGMRAAFKRAAGLTSDAWVGPISREGAHVVG
jgi:homoserine kinase